jgi:uncharacterized membrane protein YdjX (TVP38/TMEM64 family)
MICWRCSSDRLAWLALVLRYLRVLGVLAILLAVPFVLSRTPLVRDGLVAAVALMCGGGAGGVAVYVAANAVGCTLTVPIWLFAGMAGYAYGPVRGLLLASPANVVAMTTTFLFGRFVLSRPLGRRLARSPRWNAVHGAVAADPLRIGFLLRFMPIAPQNLFSYGFSLTPMRTGTFMAVTWLGLLPMIAFQVYVGSLVHDVADLIDGKRPPLGVWGWAATAGGVLATLAALAIAARLGQRALARQGV